MNRNSLVGYTLLFALVSLAALVQAHAKRNPSRRPM
jgi:hypothetical protein